MGGQPGFGLQLWTAARLPDLENGHAFQNQQRVGLDRVEKLLYFNINDYVNDYLTDWEMVRV